MLLGEKVGQHSLYITLQLRFLTRQLLSSPIPSWIYANALCSGSSDDFKYGSDFPHSSGSVIEQDKKEGQPGLGKPS